MSNSPEKKLAIAVRKAAEEYIKETNSRFALEIEFIDCAMIHEKEPRWLVSRVLASSITDEKKEVA